MLSVILSKSALIFYLFVILTEFATKRGIRETETTGKSFILSLADLCGICSLIFLVFYSMYTVWWAFILLLIVYVLIYRIVRFFISLAFINKKYIYIISVQSRYLLIPLIILMFVLVKK